MAKKIKSELGSKSKDELIDMAYKEDPSFSKEEYKHDSKEELIKFLEGGE